MASFVVLQSHKENHKPCILEGVHHEDMHKLSQQKCIQDVYFAKTDGVTKDEVCIELFCDLSHRQLNDWFKSKGGQEKAMVEHPVLTEEQKVDQMKWCTAHIKELAQSEEQHFVWLDEKWFYCRNHKK